MHREPIAHAVALEPEPGRPVVDVEWLEQTWERPDALTEGLQAWLGSPSTPGFKSVPGGSHDLYHDLVSRHLRAERIALRWYDRNRERDGGWASITYDELDRRCAVRAAAWVGQGVEPGAVVAVVLPFGVEAVVSLLTGLRVGACVSVVEPLGPAYVARRLDALAPPHVASDLFYDPWLGDLAGVRLAAEGMEAAIGAASHSYAADEPCALLLSPLRHPEAWPVPLTAARAYRGALRDGAITLALRPGDAVAAPGLPREQHQPALLLATLAAGATFVHLSPDDALRDPTLLDAFPLRSVGLDAAMCEAWLRVEANKPRWQHVFRNPEEPTDWEAWRELIETLELQRTPMSNVVFEAASGGALLASPRRRGSDHLAALMNVVPAAGQPWMLLDFTGTGQPSVGDAGVFAPLPDEPMHIALGRRRGGEYLYGGTLEPRRSGRVYPVEEVLAALEDCPFLHGASVAVAPAGGSTLAWRFVLLGFCGHEPRARFETLREPRIEELQRMLVQRVGAWCLPDRVELFPLLPRMAEDAVDHAWCQTQFDTGTLFAKARTPLFHHTTALRQLATTTR